MIVGMVCVLNEEELLDDFFVHNLHLVDKMVIAEGAVEGNPFSNSHGHSIDKTNEILLEWKEGHPDNIEIVINNVKWKSKQHQQNVMLDYIEEGDWAWIMAADELYMPNTRKILDSLIEKYPVITEFIPSFIHFWDKNNIIVPYSSKDYRLLQRHQRVIKFENFYYYYNHPTLNSSQELDTFYDKAYKDRRMILDMPENTELPIHFGKLVGKYNTNPKDSITIFHYGYIRSFEQQLRKSVYYLMRDKSMSPDNALEFVKEKINELGSIYGYVSQLHSNSSMGTIEHSDNHPLKDKEWNYNEDIDFNNILKYLKDFNEKPKK